VVILILFMSSGGNVFRSFSSSFISTENKFADSGIATEMLARGIAPSFNVDFAPEVEERQITKTTNIASEIDRGEFKEAETKVLDVVKVSGSILLNQDISKRGKGKTGYSVGRFTIKVDTEKYDSIISQLKSIGKTTSFNENQRDITQQFDNLEIEIDSEKSRLQKFQQQLQQTNEAEFKIQLTDRIFNQERRIKYLEDSLKNAGNRVAYSTIYLTITEERSSFSNIVFIKFGDLWRSFVNSLNSMLKFLFYIVPWLVAFLILRFVYRRFLA